MILAERRFFAKYAALPGWRPRVILASLLRTVRIRPARRRRIFHLRRVAVFSGTAGCVASLLLACGSRTGLFGDEELIGVTVPTDASRDGADGQSDARSDARDGGSDGRDAVSDADADALPVIDAQLPEDATVSAFCADAETTLIYLVSAQNELLSFYPPDQSFRSVGPLNCPAGGATPFSMAVARTGTAYVLYTNGQLFRVSTRTAACSTTGFVPNQLNFSTFGMGFASDDATDTETLYVVDPADGATQARLGAIDATTFVLRQIGPMGPQVPRAELTGTGDGRLFGYWPTGEGQAGGGLGQINKATGSLIAQNALSVGRRDDAFAFAFWGGDFWIFTASSSGQPSDITRYNLATQTATLETKAASTIVGAGVSTCAPP